MHPEQKYIQYLLDNQHGGIQLIYKQYGRVVVNMIVKNNGTEDDGWDILQESLVDIYHIAKNRDFQLTTSFQSFLLLVAKRKWLNTLKKNKHREVTNVDDTVFNVEDEGEKMYADYLVQEEREQVIMELLLDLGERCQEIIRRCMQSKHQEKIAEALGITYAYLRKKKSECMAKLSEKVKEHPLFRKK
ncbi:RNA polymerase sigma factor [Sphingobacterium wenxiniae]|uniref:RNA polymerase sigma factor, sigma-70 family n=1 Tax=Sphingobacterium wenxiniae TaxID=683125 RepID=A0A1I6T098_9SPHI|nr:sigma-70 family RNA polymerase sigma factor [Sphingobacterium wenxiniae]SFS82679.1 RNA polymerase sigma factor, sigma-70 family [Sphingobacterium wenxiniae]